MNRCKRTCNRRVCQCSSNAKANNQQTSPKRNSKCIPSANSWHTCLTDSDIYYDATDAVGIPDGYPTPTSSKLIESSSLTTLFQKGGDPQQFRLALRKIVDTAENLLTAIEGAVKRTSTEKYERSVTTILTPKSQFFKESSELTDQPTDLGSGTCMCCRNCRHSANTERAIERSDRVEWSDRPKISAEPISVSVPLTLYLRPDIVHEWRGGDTASVAYPDRDSQSQKGSIEPIRTAAISMQKERVTTVQPDQFYRYNEDYYYHERTAQREPAQEPVDGWRCPCGQAQITDRSGAAKNDCNRNNPNLNSPSNTEAYAGLRQQPPAGPQEEIKDCISERDDDYEESDHDHDQDQDQDHDERGGSNNNYTNLDRCESAGPLCDVTCEGTCDAISEKRAIHMIFPTKFFSPKGSYECTCSNDLANCACRPKEEERKPRTSKASRATLPKAPFRTRKELKPKSKVPSALQSPPPEEAACGCSCGKETCNECCTRPRPKKDRPRRRRLTPVERVSAPDPAELAQKLKATAKPQLPKRKCVPEPAAQPCEVKPSANDSSCSYEDEGVCCQHPSDSPEETTKPRQEPAPCPPCPPAPKPSRAKAPEQDECPWSESTLKNCFQWLQEQQQENRPSNYNGPEFEDVCCVGCAQKPSGARLFVPLDQQTPRALPECECGDPETCASTCTRFQTSETDSCSPLQRSQSQHQPQKQECDCRCSRKGSCSQACCARGQSAQPCLERGASTAQLYASRAPDQAATLPPPPPPPVEPTAPTSIDDKLVPLLESIYEVLQCMRDEKQQQVQQELAQQQQPKQQQEECPKDGDSEKYDQYHLACDQPQPQPPPCAAEPVRNSLDLTTTPSYKIFITQMPDEELPALDMLKPEQYEMRRMSPDWLRSQAFLENDSQGMALLEPAERDVELGVSLPSSRSNKTQRLIPVDMDLLRTDEEYDWEPRKDLTIDLENTDYDPKYARLNAKGSEPESFLRASSSFRSPMCCQMTQVDHDETEPTEPTDDTTDFTPKSVCKAVSFDYQSPPLSFGEFKPPMAQFMRFQTTDCGCKDKSKICTGECFSQEDKAKGSTRSVCSILKPSRESCGSEVLEGIQTYSQEDQIREIPHRPCKQRLPIDEQTYVPMRAAPACECQNALKCSGICCPSSYNFPAMNRLTKSEQQLARQDLRYRDGSALPPTARPLVVSKEVQAEPIPVHMPQLQECNRPSVPPLENLECLDGAHTVEKSDIGTDRPEFDDDAGCKPCCPPTGEQVNEFVEAMLLDLHTMKEAREQASRIRANRGSSSPASTIRTVSSPRSTVPPDVSYPATIEKVQELGPTSLFVKWKVHSVANIAGYEIYLDGQLTNRYFSYVHRAAVICDVNLECPHQIVLRAQSQHDLKYKVLKPKSFSFDKNSLTNPPNPAACCLQPNGSVWYPSVYHYEPN